MAKRNIPATRQTSAHINTSLTRSDCVRDNIGVLLNHLPYISYLSNVVKRGYWVGWNHCEKYTTFSQSGRAIGRVTCEGKVYVEVVEFSPETDIVLIKWILPEDITYCRKTPPTNALNFMQRDFSSAETVLKELEEKFY